MFENLFNKPKENSKVEQQKNTALGVSSIKIIAKNTLNIVTLAKELKVINKSFKQLVRLEGGQPADSQSLKSYKSGSMKELHIADRKVKRMKEEQRPADFLVVLFDKFTTVLKLVFLGTLLSGIILSEKIIEWMDIGGMYKKLTSFFDEISDGIVNFFKSIDWIGEIQNHIGNLVQFISFGMFTKKDALLIVEGAGNFTSEILHRFGEILLSAAKIVKEHFEKLGRFLAIDLLGVDYEEIDRQKKERDAAVEMSDSLKKDSDALDVEIKSLQDKRNMLNEKKYKRERDAVEQKAKQQEEEAKKKETVGDKLKRAFTPKEAVVEEKPAKVSTGAAAFPVSPEVGKRGPVAAPTPAAAAPTPAPMPVTPVPTSKAEEKEAAKPSDAKPVKISSTQGKNAMLNVLNTEKISDPTQRAAIMAQVGHESGNFTTLSENLMYSAKGLMGTFKKYFPSEDIAKKYEKNPAKIADRVYGGRMGNAPEGSGEGFLYRGRGFVQLTGKNNYKKFGYIGDPDALTKPEKAAESAMKFISGYKGDWKNVKTLTKFVNGGYIGLEDREKHFIAYLDDPQITQMGIKLAENSTDVSTEQRKQEKRKNPVIVNAGTTNNTAVKNKNNVVAAT